MNRSIKAMLAALLAVFVMGAMASLAAAEGELHHEFTNTQELQKSVITGEQEAEPHIFDINGVEVKCTTATFAGTVEGKTADKVRVHPTYGKTGGKCSLGSIEVTVDTTGCDYVFESDTTENPHTETNDASVTIDCEEGSQIKITGACEARVTPHQLLHGVTYTNIPNIKETGKEGITVKATVSTIHTITTGGFACGVVGLGFGESTWQGTYTGNSEITGYEDTCSVAHECPFEEAEGGDKDTYTEGSQIDIAVETSSPAETE